MCAPSEGGSILLVGFMGAGKSTVARELAEATGWPWIDLDRLIVESAGREIAELFAEHGEEAFRALETAALRSLVGRPRAIVATGGGIVGREANWELMRQLGQVVYLRCRWQTLRQRIAATSGRPLADGRDWERVEELWRLRLPLYEQAELVVEADQASPGELAREICQRLQMEQTRWRD